MNDLPRQKLRDLIARHGRLLAGEPRRCEALLRDYCSPYRREIAVLVSAAEERIPTDLLATGTGLPREALLARLAQRLHDNVAMEKTAATWAVHSWALALGVVSDTELEAIERGGAKSVAMTPSVSTGAAARPQTEAGPSPRSIVVSVTGDGDYTSLNEALRNAAPGVRLLVRPGLYQEGLVIDKPVEIIGDGKRREIILASEGPSCLLMHTHEATVRGLTLRQEEAAGNDSEGFFAVDIPQGRLTLEDCDITSASLSCIGIHNELTVPIIRRCRIHSGADSGIYIFNAAGGQVEDCDIYDNRNIGVAITEGAAPVIKGCSIRDGKDAGLVAWNGGAGVVEECNIFSNAKANVGISEAGDLTIRRCRIYGGKNSGVFVHNKGQGALEECDIYHHEDAEVAITTGGNLMMRDCKIHDGKQAGAFLSDEGTMLMDGCKVYDNADAGVSVEAGGIAAIRQCRIKGNGTVAIRVNEGGAANVVDCDLTDNRIAAWQTEYGAIVESSGNSL
jgi:nitrous oxidase accessory protein NosD